MRREDPDRCARTPGTLPDAPLVLAGKRRGALTLRAVDARALAVGLTPGLALADARVRQPDLIVADMDEVADRRWLGRLARRCIRWSPRVMAVSPDGITLDITGCAHLFGGEAGLTAEVEEAMAVCGMTARLAVASTPEAAQALARHAPLSADDERQAIRALPVAALGLEEEALVALRRAGLKSIGDVAARPSASIAARFGMEAVTAIERLIGGEQAPIVALKQQQPLRFERRFADPITHQDVIAKVLLELMQEAARALEELGYGGRRFRLELRRSDGATHALDIATGEPTRDPALVLRLFDERIGALADPLDPGFGYDSMLLAVPGTEPLAAAHLAFDDAVAGGGSAERDMAELIDRLSTRLGPGAVRRMVPCDSHIPEQAQLALPTIECGPPARWPAPWPGEPPLRPLLLFDPPQPVEVVAEVPDGPPHRFRWRRKLYEVRLYEGPERIAAEWWRHKGGEHAGQSGLTRDYYRVEDVRGRRFWIFRHGLYAQKPDPRWYLHGLFA